MKQSFVHCLMCCLVVFQVDSLTVNISLSDVTNKIFYSTLLNVELIYEKYNRSLLFSGSRKIPTLVQLQTWQASFPTGRVGPRGGIFLSQLNTNDGFYLYPLPLILTAFLYAA